MNKCPKQGTRLGPSAVGGCAAGCAISLRAVGGADQLAKVIFRVCRLEGAHSDPRTEDPALANLDRCAMAGGGKARKRQIAGEVLAAEAKWSGKHA